MFTETKTLDLGPGPRGRPPVAWLPRQPGELARRVRLPAGGEVWLLTSWEAVNAVLHAGDRPWAPMPFAITYHPWRYPDFNTLPGPRHRALRRYFVKHIGRNPALTEGVRPHARGLATGLDLRRGGDVVAGYIRPLLDATMTDIGFPPLSWQTAVSERLVYSRADEQPARTAMHDALRYAAVVRACHLASPGVTPLELIGSEMKHDLWTEQDVWRMYRITRTAGASAGDPLAGVLWDLLTPGPVREAYLTRPRMRPLIVAERIRTRWNFGLMNVRHVPVPRLLSDGTVIEGYAVPSMRAALTDEARWGPGGAGDHWDDRKYAHAEPFGWGPYGCPAFGLGFEQVNAGADEFIKAHPRAVLDGDPVIVPGLVGGAPGALPAREPG